MISLEALPDDRGIFCYKFFVTQIHINVYIYKFIFFESRELNFWGEGDTMDATIKSIID